MSNMAPEQNTSVAGRAKAIAAMGLVGRDFEGFNVTAPGFRKETFRVWKDEEGHIQCSCAEFQERIGRETRFRCEHILAVKFHLESEEDNVGNKEQIELQTAVSNETPLEAVSPTKQQEVVSSMTHNENGNIHLVNGKQNGRVIPFEQLLETLSHSVQPEMVKQRVGWRDRQGREHEVDYVEWHTVADLLDRICPDWSHEVVNIKQIGDLVAVTASLTIQGVTRQGIGTGSAYDETGIKKAEHDALKRAAVKFGIARELYRREEEEMDATINKVHFPKEPIAKTMAELVTPRQLVAIRAIANSQKIDAEAECKELLNCKPEELSRRAASAFIDYLKSKNSDEASLRQAG